MGILADMYQEMFPELGELAQADRDIKNLVIALKCSNILLRGMEVNSIQPTLNDELISEIELRWK